MSEGRVSLFGIANLFLRQKRVMIGVPLAAVLTAVLITALEEREFEASSKLVAEGASGSAPLSSLAARFGVAVPGGSGGPPVAFYADLLRSPEIRMSMAAQQFTATEPDGRKRTGYLSDLYGISAKTPEEKISASAGIISGRVRTTTDPSTGVITLRVSARWREMSVALNREVLRAANDFLQNRRQSRAGEESRFVRLRRDEARDELAAAEAGLRAFLEQNRQYQTSPQLTFQFSRLQRAVELRQEVYVSLAQAYEQARIEEVRNTPFISILERPEYGVGMESAGMLTNALLALILGLFGAAGFVVLRAYLERQPSENPEDFAEFRVLAKPALRRKARPAQG